MKTLAVALAAAVTLTSCEYVRLLRPRVLKQLNPRVARLVNELPNVDEPNKAIVARLFAHGGLSRADLGDDGVFHSRIYVPKNQYIWYPAIVTMDCGGDLELEFSNDDVVTHAAFVPSDGDREATPMGKELWGHVKAYDPATGREVWSWRAPHPMLSSLLTTAGGLVFAGEPNGRFDAFDARTGEPLWSFQTGSGIHSSPVTYAVNGKQYIAVPVGWGGWVEGYAPEMYGAPRGTSLMVFAVP